MCTVLSVCMYSRTECSFSGARVTEHATLFRLAFSRRAQRDAFGTQSYQHLVAEAINIDLSYNNNPKMANIEDIMSTIFVVDDNKADDKTASATSATAFPSYPGENCFRQNGLGNGVSSSRQGRCRQHDQRSRAEAGSVVQQRHDWWA